MEWREDGLIVSVRRHGETSVIADILTRGHGRHAGLVRGGRSRAMRPVLQPGNRVHATWRARLEDHLGTYAVEPDRLAVASVIDDAHRLAALTTVAALATLLPEREPHPRLYDAALLLLDHLLDDDIWPALLVRWEMGLLDELGFGLDLSACAAGGANDDLAFVSPRTGRAVSASEGAPWKDKLLALPRFLVAGAGAPRPSEVAAGLKLTGHFLERHLFGPRGMHIPEQRQRIVRWLEGK